MNARVNAGMMLGVDPRADGRVEQVIVVNCMPGGIDAYMPNPGHSTHARACS